MVTVDAVAYGTDNMWLGRTKRNSRTRVYAGKRVHYVTSAMSILVFLAKLQQSGKLTDRQTYRQTPGITHNLLGEGNRWRSNRADLKRAYSYQIRILIYLQEIRVSWSARCCSLSG